MYREWINNEKINTFSAKKNRLICDVFYRQDNYAPRMTKQGSISLYICTYIYIYMYIVLYLKVLQTINHNSTARHAGEYFPNLAKSNWNQIVFTVFRLIWNRKRTLSVCCFQIKRKMVNTIWFQFDLVRFRKDFSVCGNNSPQLSDKLPPLEVMVNLTLKPLNIILLWCCRGFRGPSIGPH